MAVLCVALTGCASRPPVAQTDPWAYEDLRALSPAGADLPSHDIIALYNRQAGGDLQVRLDLLDLTFEPDGDLYMALDWRPGGTRDLPLEATAELEWDILLVLPVQGQPYALAPGGTSGEAFIPFPSLIPRIARIPWQDTVVISFNPNPLTGIERGYSLQAFVTASGAAEPADSLGPLRSDTRPPDRAPVMLAFWNTFPAYSPAQALRRWDGAHTGPFGGRHGLHVLLQAVQRARVPVYLLDLKAPESISALDYLGGSGEIQELASEGLLVLPDNLPGSPSLRPSPQAFPAWAVARSAGESRLTGVEFGLGASPILYSPSLELLAPVTPAAGMPPYAWIVTPLPEPGTDEQATGKPLRWKNFRLLPLPQATKEHQATPDGLSVGLRLALLSLAMAGSEDGSQLLVLGGDLVDSAWGEPESARESLQYIAAHPWIQPYGQADLLALRPNKQLEEPAPRPGDEPFTRPPAGSDNPSESSDLIPLFTPTGSQQIGQVPARLVAELPIVLNSTAYERTLTRAAWQTYRSLFTPLPPEHPQLPSLRARYANFPLMLVEAARWAARPEPKASCDLALDADGRPGCILASERVFSVFDPLGGRLLALFAYSPSGGLHQLVAPTSQFTIGFGDPSTWDLAAGPGAEPGGVHGAFADSQPPWELYSVEVIENGLVFISPDGSLVKTFALLESGLRVEYSAPTASNDVHIPLALDPWDRFTSGWGDRFAESSNSHTGSWQLEGGPRAEVRTSGELSAIFFSDSRSQLGRVEDPNFPYPTGHYLPFAMAVVEIKASQFFFVEISLESEE